MPSVTFGTRFGEVAERLKGEVPKVAHIVIVMLNTIGDRTNNTFRLPMMAKTQKTERNSKLSYLFRELENGGAELCFLDKLPVSITISARICLIICYGHCH